MTGFSGTRKKKRKEEREKGKRGRGRPRIEIDEEQLFLLATYCGTHDEIAAVLKVSNSFIEKGVGETGEKFVDIIERGRLVGNVSLRRKQFQIAMGGDVSMLKHLGQCRLGQRPSLELTGANGAPLVPAPINVNFATWIPDGDEDSSDTPRLLGDGNTIDVEPEKKK